MLGRRLCDRSLDGTNGAALVRLRPHNLAEQWLLHAGGGQTRHIVRCGHVLLVHEPVRAIEVAVHKFELGCIIVHLIQEVLDVVRMVVELVRADALLVFLVVAAPLVDEATEVLGEDEGCIVP